MKILFAVFCLVFLQNLLSADEKGTVNAANIDTNPAAGDRDRETSRKHVAIGFGAGLPTANVLVSAEWVILDFLSVNFDTGITLMSYFVSAGVRVYPFPAAPYGFSIGGGTAMSYTGYPNFYFYIETGYRFIFGGFFIEPSARANINALVTRLFTSDILDRLELELGAAF